MMGEQNAEQRLQEIEAYRSQLPEIKNAEERQRRNGTFELFAQKSIDLLATDPQKADQFFALLAEMIEE